MNFLVLRYNTYIMKKTFTEYLESIPTWGLGGISIVSILILWSISVYPQITLLFTVFSLLTSAILYVLIDIPSTKIFLWLTVATWAGALIVWGYAGVRSTFIWECFVGADGSLFGYQGRCQTGEIYLSILTIPVVFQTAYWNKKYILLQSELARILQISAISLPLLILMTITVYGVSLLSFAWTFYTVIIR